MALEFLDPASDQTFHQVGELDEEVVGQEGLRQLAQPRLEHARDDMNVRPLVFAQNVGPADPALVPTRRGADGEQTHAPACRHSAGAPYRPNAKCVRRRARSRFEPESR